MKTNGHSCLLDSFAHVTGVPAQFLINNIGHNGCPYGFHTQELIGPLVELGFAVTLIELNPIALNEKGETWEIEFAEGTFRRFCRHMHGSRGVLIGSNKAGRCHAVAWDGRMVYDSAIDLHYPLLAFNENVPVGFLEAGFKPRQFWKVTDVA